MENRRIKLSINEVNKKLLPGDMIHTFTQAGFTLLGCDMKREKILQLANEFGAEIAGEVATRMKHGVIVYNDKEAIFCETI